MTTAIAIIDRHLIPKLRKKLQLVGGFFFIEVSTVCQVQLRRDRARVRVAETAEAVEEMNTNHPAKIYTLSLA